MTEWRAPLSPVELPWWRLLEVIDLIWGYLPASSIRDLEEADPSAVEICRLAHEAVWHQEDSVGTFAAPPVEGLSDVQDAQAQGQRGRGPHSGA